MKCIKRAGAIIYDRSCSKILLVMNRWSRYNNEEKWGCPKGHRHDDETVEQCAIREVFEETGICLMINKNTPYIVFKDTVYFIVRLSNTTTCNPGDTKEICEVSWTGVKELKKLNMNEALRFISNYKPHTHIRIPIKIGLGPPVALPLPVC